jgi:hypothetical protein
MAGSQCFRASIHRLERLRLRLAERLRLVRERLRLPPARLRVLFPRLLPPPLRVPPARLRLVERLAAELARLLPLFFRRVEAALRAEAEREDFDREAEARPPIRPPFLDELRLVFFPRPEPLFLPPPVSLFTVAQARRSASRRETPRFS